MRKKKRNWYKSQANQKLQRESKGKQQGDKAALWLKLNEEKARQALAARKQTPKKSRYAPENQDSFLFWQEVWRQNQALRERLGDSA